MLFSLAESHCESSCCSMDLHALMFLQCDNVYLSVCNFSPKFSAPRRPLIRKSNRKGLPTPLPTEYVGDKPAWEEFKQKGNKCVATTSAAVPCKDPIPGNGKSIISL